MTKNALYTAAGERKYLNAQEREAFHRSALSMPPHIRTYGLFIYYTGVRTSEALEVTPERLNFEDNTVLIRTLKQNPNKPDKFRVLDLPETFLFSLESEYKAKTRKQTQRGHKDLLWPFTDRTGQNYVKKIMTAAGIEGVKATARGLRHSVGVMMAMHKIPMNVISGVLGHEYPKNTLVYMQIMGQERRELIAAIW